MKLHIVGVDVSKETFDASKSEREVTLLSNDESGFEAFVAWLPADAHVVMEATGTYYLKLATYLFEQGMAVSVVNPVKVSYFAKMRLQRVKTDRTDAGVIRRYGEYDTTSLWQPGAQVFIELNQLDSHLAGLQKDLNRVIGRLEALTQHVTIDTFTLNDLLAQQADLEARVNACEKELVDRTKKHFADLYALLTSITGIGPKTAVMFIVLTHGFNRFPSAKMFAAYLGTTSFISTSGSSVKGSGAITKMGHPRMRQLLYMAALTAKRRNIACQVFADRLKVNGKPPKVIRIAVANKLIRQMFAVCEKQEKYSEVFA